MSEVKRLLEESRKKLLDLSLRNPLLNYNLKRKNRLVIVDELPNVLYEKLLNGEKLRFDAVPYPEIEENNEDDSEDKDENTGLSSAKKHAETLRINTNEIAPLYSGTLERKHKDKAIQTLHYPDTLERILQNKRRAANTAIQETGSNLLYLAIGFLEWKKSADSDRTLNAPLILIPVQITSGAPNRSSGVYTYWLEYTGEDLFSNITLQYKIRNDFNIEIPSLQEEENPEEYFARIDEICKDKKELIGVGRRFVLDFFHFSKLLMYMDLDPSSWPQDRKLDEHPVLEEISGEKTANIATPSFESNDPEATENLNLVLDADSSQRDAIAQVLKGNNLIIEGPPGTGKSQTIANLIAAALAEGKTVLFVAEKLVALEVVKRRLDNTGLGHFVLELHSHKANKTNFYGALRERVELETPNHLAEINESIDEIENIKKSLKEYLEELHTPFGISKKTPYQLFGEVEKRYETIFSDALSLPVFMDMNDHKIKEAVQHFTAVEQILKENPKILNSPWQGFFATNAISLDAELIVDLFKSYLQALEKMSGVLSDNDLSKVYTVNHDFLSSVQKALAENLFSTPPSHEKIKVIFSLHDSQWEKVFSLSKEIIIQLDALSNDGLNSTTSKKLTGAINLNELASWSIPFSQLKEKIDSLVDLETTIKKAPYQEGQIDNGGKWPFEKVKFHTVMSENMPSLNKSPYETVKLMYDFHHISYEDMHHLPRLLEMEAKQAEEVKELFVSLSHLYAKHPQLQQSIWQGYFIANMTVADSHFITTLFQKYVDIAQQIEESISLSSEIENKLPKESFLASVNKAVDDNLLSNIPALPYFDIFGSIQSEELLSGLKKASEIDQFTQNFAHLDISYSNDNDIETLQEFLRELRGFRGIGFFGKLFNKEYKQARKKFLMVCTAPDAPKYQLNEMINFLEVSIKNMESAISKFAEISRNLKEKLSIPSEITTNIKEIMAYCQKIMDLSTGYQWLESMRQAGFTDSELENFYHPSREQYRDKLMELHQESPKIQEELDRINRKTSQLHVELDETEEKLSQYGTLDHETFFQGKTSFSDKTKIIHDKLSSNDSLSLWINRCGLLDQISSLGLIDFWDYAKTRGLETELPSLFTYLYCRSWLDMICKNNQVVEKNLPLYEEIYERFHELYELPSITSLEYMAGFVDQTIELAKNFQENNEKLNQIVVGTLLPGSNSAKDSLQDFGSLLALESAYCWCISMQKCGFSLYDLEPFSTADQEKNISLMQDLYKNAMAVMSEIEQCESEILRYGVLKKDIFFQSHQSYKDQCVLLEKKLENPQYLGHWIDISRLLIDIETLGLSPILNFAIEKKIENKMASLIQYAYYRDWAHQALRSNTILAKFNRQLMETKLVRFRELDQKLAGLYARSCASALTQKYIPYGEGGKVSEKTDMQLVRNEIEKQKRHLPIRPFLKRAADAVRALKPCYMMSPLSVSQYIDPKQEPFDLMIMDEASQVLPEDSLGAIARARQVVVVGDPNQLPPTSFFSSISLQEDPDEEETAATSAESILDLMLRVYPNIKRLKWHYRSRHESLISFSNHHFYRSELMIFPSPDHGAPHVGISREFIPNAYFKDQHNPVEAGVIVKAICKHLIEKQDESLGVVVMNKKQADYLERLLEETTKEDDHLRVLVDKASAEERLFVKNLENVQGDEADTLFIGITYGPDSESRKVYQRFGPINGDQGWRRMNVLVTRAKQRIVVFTSLISDNVVAQEGNRGRSALKNYLKFIETGKMIPSPRWDPNQQPDSPFEESVIRYIESLGYEVHPQVGVSGFFIDIGVKLDGSYNYILGIECDGATYHSSKSARDRDRIRQEILESMGWSLHRIWSTDWFKHRNEEQERLKKALEAVKSNAIKYEPEPEHPSETPDEITTQEAPEPSISKRHSCKDDLKNKLITFRNKQIAPKYPIDSRCLLSDRMIDLLARTRPTSIEEFRMEIPQYLREKIDVQQMEFMNEILEMLL